MIAKQPLQADGQLDNAQLAERLTEIADLLDAQRANAFRSRAYRTAAETVRRLSRPVRQILVEEPTDALTRLPGIGSSIARTLKQLSQTGHVPLLDQLRGTFGPEEKLTSVPGIGRKTATLIHAALGIETLADLQAAAFDGRLARVPGIGHKRLQAVRESLAGRFRSPARVARSKSQGLQTRTRAATEQTSAETVRLVEELLSVDDEYRRKAAADELLRIAPRRFNPTGEAWLPILEIERHGRRYKAMFSNTARAHELETLRDWVVIFRNDLGTNDARHNDAALNDAAQWTVLTSRFGKLRGRRIVRGWERECAEHYAHRPPHPLSLFDSDADQGLDPPLANGGG